MGKNGLSWHCQAEGPEEGLLAGFSGLVTFLCRSSWPPQAALLSRALGMGFTGKAGRGSALPSATGTFGKVRGFS